MLTGPEAGITRDTIASELQWLAGSFRLHDTAGLRRPPRIQEKLEKLSVADAINAIRFAEVVVLLMDTQNAFEEQDLRIAALCEREGRALVIGISKWDLKERKAGSIGKLQEQADERLPQVKGVPVIGVSGLTGDGVDRLMEAIVDIHEVWNKRVTTNELNKWLEDVVSAHPPPAVSGRRIRLNYVTQAKARPPTFVLFCARADAVPAAYTRYLVNGLRENFDMPGTPIRLTLREKANPFAGRKRSARERDRAAGRGRTRAAARGLHFHLHHRRARHALARHDHAGAAEARRKLHGRRHRARGRDLRRVRHRLGADAVLLLADAGRAVRQLRPAAGGADLELRPRPRLRADGARAQSLVAVRRPGDLRRFRPRRSPRATPTSPTSRRPSSARAKFGMLGAAFGLGFVLGPALGGVLGAIDPRMPFWVAAGLEPAQRALWPSCSAGIPAARAAHAGSSGGAPIRSARSSSCARIPN